MGGTAGRTTMLGEGLQHQDGHSIVLASTVPTCVTYDPAFVYELAVVVQDGIRRMYEKGEDVFYYITMYNEDYAMPAMPEGVSEGILRGMYKLKPATGGEAVAQLFGSGTILNEVLRAQEILATKYGVHADVWSVTSYTELRRDALAVERWNRLHPAEKERQSYLQTTLAGTQGADHRGQRLHEVVPDQLSPWLHDATGDAGNGWLWPQRQSRASAAALRGECGVDRRSDAVEARARGQVQAEAGTEGAGGARP